MASASSAFATAQWSLPVRGAWVEMIANMYVFSCFVPSLPVRGAWVEIFRTFPTVRVLLLSLPVRGAWVEIGLKKEAEHGAYVAPRAGSVG